jgi:hypothetical protein
VSIVYSKEFLPRFLCEAFGRNERSVGVAEKSLIGRMSLVVFLDMTKCRLVFSVEHNSGGDCKSWEAAVMDFCLVKNHDELLDVGGCIMLPKRQKAPESVAAIKRHLNPILYDPPILSFCFMAEYFCVNQCMAEFKFLV